MESTFLLRVHILCLALKFSVLSVIFQSVGPLNYHSSHSPLFWIRNVFVHYVYFPPFFTNSICFCSLNVYVIDSREVWAPDSPLVLRTQSFSDVVLYRAVWCFPTFRRIVVIGPARVKHFKKSPLYLNSSFQVFFICKPSFFILYLFTKSTPSFCNPCFHPSVHYPSSNPVAQFVPF